MSSEQSVVFQVVPIHHPNEGLLERLSCLPGLLVIDTARPDTLLDDVTAYH